MIERTYLASRSRSKEPKTSAHAYQRLVRLKRYENHRSKNSEHSVQPIVCDVSFAHHDVSCRLKPSVTKNASLSRWNRLRLILKSWEDEVLVPTCLSPDDQSEFVLCTARKTNGS